MSYADPRKYRSWSSPWEGYYNQPEEVKEDKDENQISFSGKELCPNCEIRPLNNRGNCPHCD